MNVQTQMQSMAQQRRQYRRPTHTWQVRHRPWVIQPTMIAPVLPGETLRNLTFQARVVSDPIRNPLIGWFCEHYFFYVKHRDLDERDHLTSMVLDPGYDLSSLNEAADASYYHYGGTIPWAKLCLKRVVDEYFRNEDEAWDAFTIDGMPIASISRESWLDSVMEDATYKANDGAVPDLDSDSNTDVSEIERAMMQWQFLRANNMTSLSYEDYLRTYGVRVQAEEHHKPELIRYSRDWTYPTNTVDPATGAPSSAASWSIQERADKDRYFKEPGFILGVTVARPKVYLSQQSGAAVGLLDNAYTWLPALLMNDPVTSAKQVDAGNGPLPNATNAYWVDVRDLFLYGDQLVNFDMTATDAGMVALPTAGMEKRYTDKAMADALFVDETADGKQLIRQDGVASMSIASHQRDVSPTV
jgi:hypothetical protein